MNQAPLSEKETVFSDARLRTLATTTSVVLWYTSADGAIATRNPSWEAFTGQNFEQCQGWGWADAIHPDDRQRVRDSWQTGVGSRELFETHYRLRRHDGEYREVAAQGAPVLEGAEVREWVGFCVDA